MARFNHDVSAYLEYAAILPVLLVIDAALDRSNWTDADYEAYGEQLAEIGMERHLGGSREAMYDAKRIWDWQRKQSALRYFANVAPMHREAALGYAEVMPI